MAFSDPYGLRAGPCPPCEAALSSPFPPLRALGGIAAAGAAVYVAAKAASDKINDYKFVTYTRTNAATGQVYSGRTSGFGDPHKIVATRAAGHDPRLAGFGPAELEQVAPGNLAGYQAIRGREQQLIDANGGAQSEGGTSANLIRGVSKVNPAGEIFHESSNAAYGELHEYTGK